MAGGLAFVAAACGAGERRGSQDRALEGAPQDMGSELCLASSGGEVRREAADTAGIVSEAVPIGATGFSRGRSTTVVKAPIERVRAAVLSFDRYPEFMPHYKQCRLLGRTPNGGWDVYMEVSALQGAVTMWARIEIQKPVVADGVETYTSRFVSGNVRDLQATWRLEKIDARTTRLSLEVFLRPKLPLPKRLVNAENLEGSSSAIAAMRARLEQSDATGR
ncbi:type II toxin-antitoxin system RatA family toxin [Sorangium sp. So ce131]|uniref:type II toxin-antitoxin system RatA family toxin n=1 Tax=Sorangium sp. So ce131 TaxID=3133282 RepID=UPI003F646420